MDSVPFKKCRPHAKVPNRQTAGSAGFDLCAAILEPVTIAPEDTVMIPTGIAIALPRTNVAAFVFARSSLGAKHGVIPANGVGVIDSDYRGEIFVPLKNHSSLAFTVSPEDRIAQLIFMPVFTPFLTETENLSETERGLGGFGSTGSN